MKLATLAAQREVHQDPRRDAAPGTLTIPFARTVIPETARRAVDEVLASGWVTTGRRVLDFEAAFSAYTGARRSIAVSSCTAALELCLLALHLPEGSRVLTTTNTFCAAAAAILHAGHLPVLADVDEATGVPSADTIRRAVREVGGVDAMIAMHLGGYPVDVAEAAEAAGLPLDLVIEDAAHGLGAAVAGQGSQDIPGSQAPVGTISRATCFSFYATKNLAIGEGGMVTTADDALADELLAARLHGMSKDAWRRYLPGGGWRYDVALPGLKANLTDVQAAIGLSQLERFTADQDRRAEIAARYDVLLSGIPGLRLPLRPRGGRHAWHLYALRVEPAYPLTRDALIDELGRRGIGTSVHFIPLHHLTWHRRHAHLPSYGLPGADAVFETTLSLPFDHHLADRDVDAVCAALAEIGETR